MTEILKSNIRVDVCIATYRRPDMLGRLLESITRKLSIPEHVQLEIIVADNDMKQSAKSVVDTVSKESRIPIHYVVEPVKNIAKVRNRAISASQADFIVFIDDDEYPDELWLTQLLNTSRTYNADVVFGPVIQNYPVNCPKWIKLGRFFERKRYPTGTGVGTGATGNVLISRYILVNHKIYFDENFGLTGGSDTHLFLLLTKKGIKLVWCDEAIVYEELQKSRATARWLIKRSYRSGQVAGRVSIPYLNIKEKSYWILKRLGNLIFATTVLPISLLLGKPAYVKVLQKIAANIGHITALTGHYYEEYGVNK